MALKPDIAPFEFVCVINLVYLSFDNAGISNQTGRIIAISYNKYSRDSLPRRKSIDL